MSLLQKASIITTPTAYAEDYLYSIKPAYALGSELITQFDGVSDGTDVATLAGWSAYNTATSRNIVDEKLVIVASGSNQGAYFQAGTVAGTKYLLTATITGDLGAGGVYVNNVSNVSTESGKIEFRFTALVSATFIYFRASNNTAGTTTYADISLKPITDADFDFDRNSTGTRVNEDYLIEDVPYNLLTYSNDFSNGAWSKSNATLTSNNVISPDGTLNASKLEATGTDGLCQQSFSAISGTQYTFSVYLKTVSGTLNTNISLGSPAFPNTEGDGGRTKEIVVTNQWKRFSITSTADASASTGIGVGGFSSFSTGEELYLYGAQLVKGNKPKEHLKTTDRLDIPRIDYTNGEPSILLEPSRTNLETKSNEFSTWGIISNITRTADYTQSPEGLNNATRLQFTANGYVANTPQILGTYTMSCYAKRNDSGTQNVGFFTNGSGVVNSAWAVTSEWKRFSYTFPTLNGSYMGIAGVSGADISVYGFQIEGLVSYATSYIPTQGSTVTRSADVANNAGNSDLINSTEGVLYAEASYPDNSEASTISLTDKTNSQRVMLYWNTNNTLIFFIRVNSTYVAEVTLPANEINIKEFNKLAIKYKTDDMSFWLNGKNVGVDTSGTMFSANTLTTLAFNAGGAGSYFFGKTKCIAVFKEALTDLELEKLTGYNNHELYMNYYNRLSYLGLVEEYNVESDINNYIL